MGFGLIFTGLLFFLNFNVGIVDFLPDFFGCIFILCGLYKLRDLDGRFATAFSLTGYMAGFFALKTVVSLIQRNYTLPFTFICAAVETVYLFIFFNNLYGGIEYTAERHGGGFMSKMTAVTVTDAKTGKKEMVEKRIDLASRAAIMSYVFAVAKGILVFLPESVELLGHTDELDLSYNAKQFSASLAKPPVMLCSYLLITVAAVCFIAIAGRYLLSIRKDKTYISSISAMYKSDILTDRKLLTERTVSAGFIFALIGLVFLADPTVEFINFLPDALSYALLFIAWLIIKKQSNSNDRLPAFVIAPLILLSAANTVLGYLWNSAIRYKGTAEVIGVPEAVANGSAVYITAALSALENVLFILLLFALIRCILKLPFSKELDGLRGNLIFTRISAVVLALLSAANTVFPLAKAFLAINSDSMIDDAHDIAHFCVKLLMYISLILTVRGFVKLKEQVSLYI